jgi:hypothetical protein
MEKQEAVTTDTSNKKNENPCGVDLNWLAGRTIVRVTNELAMLTFEFEDGLVFKVQALNYKGEPFVAMTPYKDPQTA